MALLTASLSQQAGGVGVAMREVAAQIRGHGGEARVYGVRDASFERDAPLWGSTPIHAIDAKSSLGIAFAPGLSSTLAAHAHDVAHLHGLWLYPSIAASEWRRRTRLPVLISPHGMLDDWALRRARWKKLVATALYERRNLEGAACIHALTASEATSVRAFGLSNPIAVIPNGVALPDLSQRPLKPPFLGDDDRKVILFMGRIHPKKGVLETIEGWADALRKRPSIGSEWVLAFVGWGDAGHVSAAKTRARTLGIGRHVLFPGPLFDAEKEAALAHASAFVLASHSEGLPVAVLEAWSYAVPVFMTRACNLPEGFAAGAAVEILPHPSSIAQQFQTRLQDSNLPQMGLAGHALVESKFTWTRVGDEIVDVYRWLIEGGAAPPSVQRL